MCSSDLTASVVAEIVARHPEGRGGLIAVLQEIQELFGYLSPEAMDEVQRLMGISANESYGVATFYSQFRFSPPGKFNIEVCLGTACHVAGGGRILKELERLLGIKVGEVTPDGKFQLSRIACLGCCALEPVVAINGKFYPRVAPDRLPAILAEYQD